MFELEKILVQENTSTPSFNSNLNSKIEASSYTAMAMDAIVEYKSELREGTQNFYISLLESDGGIESITEAFSGFFKKIVELIKKFLKSIQKIFDKFISHLNGIVKSDKYIRKHKNVFKNFKPEHEFRYTGYEYTIEPGIPKNDFYYITDTYNYSSNKDISEAIRNFKEKYTSDLEDSYEDKLRAWVIGKEGKIASEYFSEELFGLFRNGDTSEYEFTVDKAIIDKAYKSFENYDKFIKDTKDEKDKLDRIYKARQKEIESFDKSFKESDYEKFVTTYVDPSAKTITKAKLTTEDITNISLIMKAKGDEVTKAMDVHALAFAAKLDAIKARYIQDKSILYKVLYKLGIRESGIIGDLDDIDYSAYTEANYEDINLMDHISNIAFDGERLRITNESGDVAFLEGDYDLLDFVNPSEELVKLCTEKGILQVVDGEENAFSSEIFPDDIAYKIGIEDTPNPNNISYDIFVATEAMKDAEMFAFIQEAMLEAAGEKKSEAYSLIHENLADSIKNGIRKIWNMIVTMWNKFSQTMEELFKNDVKYLEKYKDIILKKEVKIESIQCWSYFDNNHGISKAISTAYTIQSDNTNAPKTKEEVDAFYLDKANKFLTNIGSRDKVEKLGDFREAILKQLRGPETTYDSNQIHQNMKNMYDFCHDYKSNYKKSSKDLLDAVDKKSQELEREIDKAASSIKESTLLEVEINTGGGNPDKSNPSASGGNKYSQTAKDDKEALQNDAKQNKENIDAVKNDENKEADQKKDELAVKRELATSFLNYASSIIGAKLTFGEEAYKDYMKIIRAHVRMYANNEKANDVANSTTAPENTDTKEVKDNKPVEKVDRAKPAE